MDMMEIDFLWVYDDSVSYTSSSSGDRKKNKKKKIKDNNKELKRLDLEINSLKKRLNI
tara:strand:- start:7892 stop:8065 length:174 start_codon:yes stop_codon:yes gene_type:complete